MVILGIDPGFGRMGYGVVEGSKNIWHHVTHGCVETPATTDFLHRLLLIHAAVKELIATYTPDRAAVEELFFYKNAKTAMQVGQARGVILLTIAAAKVPIDEITPLQMKQAMTGYGRAEKAQIQYMVQSILGLPKKRLQDDAADALALALTAGAGAAFAKKVIS